MNDFYLQLWEAITTRSYNNKNLFAYYDANTICRTDISGNSWFGDIWKKAKKFIKKVVKNVFYSSYGEIGAEYGIGISSSVGGITAYNDPISAGFKEGDAYTGISGKAEGNVNEGKHSIGFGVSYSYKYDDGLNRNLEPHTTASSPIEVYNCPLTEVSKKLLVALDNEDVKFEIGGSFHFILGGMQN